MATDNLQIPDIQASQNSKEVTANQAHNLLDNAMNSQVSIAITGATVLTTTQTRENAVLVLTGTPGSAFTLDMPDTNARVIKLVNNSDSQCTVRNSAGAGTGQPVVQAGSGTIFSYDGTNFQEVAAAGLPTGGTTGQVLTKQSATDGDADWETLPSIPAAPTITESGTAANLLNANAGDYQRWTNAGSKTLTVQPDATESITQDAEFYIANRGGTGNLTLVEGSGVTINPPSGGGLILEPDMVATLKRVATDEYDLIGQTVA
jgi:hypothetical protein